MIRWKRLAAASVLLFASAAAHAVDTTHTFTSVVKVEHTSFTTKITGVLVNDTVLSTVEAPAAASAIGDRCARHYDTMLQNQGIYNLSVTINSNTVTMPNGTPMTTLSLLSCYLELKP